jgi:hypothetical protein
MLFLNVYGNSSISSTSPSKSMAFSYLHANVIDIVDTTAITINIRGGLITNTCRVHKKRLFLKVGKLFCESQNKL